MYFRGGWGGRGGLLIWHTFLCKFRVPYIFISLQSILTKLLRFTWCGMINWTMRVIVLLIWKVVRKLLILCDIAKKVSFTVLVSSAKLYHTNKSDLSKGFWPLCIKKLKCIFVYIIAKSMRALWLVNQLWVIVPVNPRKNRASSELLY